MARLNEVIGNLCVDVVDVVDVVDDVVVVVVVVVVVILIARRYKNFETLPK